MVIENRYSITTLRKRNNKLVARIQDVRNLSPLIKRNDFILKEQRREIAKLQNRSFRAEDPSYEKALDMKNSQTRR